MAGVKFIAPDKIGAAIKAMQNKLSGSSLTVPLEKIAVILADKMRSDIDTHLGGTWLPLAPATLKRHDAELGRETGATYSAITGYIRWWGAGASTNTKAAVMMIQGRGRDWRVGFSTKLTRKDVEGKKRRKAMKPQQRRKYGEFRAGVEAPVREFGVMDEPTKEKILGIMVGHLEYDSLYS